MYIKVVKVHIKTYEAVFDILLLNLKSPNTLKMKLLIYTTIEKTKCTKKLEIKNIRDPNNFFLCT